MCFDNFIGVDAICDTSIPSSGFYLKDIGLSVDELNAIIEREYRSGVEFANDKINFAAKVVSNLILSSFGDKLTGASIIDNERIAHQNDNAKIDAALAEYRGIEIELCNTASFLDLCLSQITLHTDFDGPVEVKVFDLMEGREIDSIEVTAVANEPVVVEISKIYSADKRPRHLFIGYDATSVGSYEYSTHAGGCTSCAKGCRSLNNHIKVRGASMGLVDQPIRKNIVGDSYTGGISLLYTISCNYELWMCSIKNLIALPILYKTGSIISQYALDSTRNNDVTMIDMEMWEKRMNSFEMNYRESMSNIVDRIKVPRDVKCFACNSPVRHVIQLP